MAPPEDRVHPHKVERGGRVVIGTVISLDSWKETYVSQFAARWVSAQFHVDRRQFAGHSEEWRVRWGPKARP